MAKKERVVFDRDKATYHPRNEFVFVKKVTEDETIGGVIRSGRAGTDIWEVIEVGPGPSIMNGGRVAIDLKAGDYVVLMPNKQPEPLMHNPNIGAIPEELIAAKVTKLVRKTFEEDEPQTTHNGGGVMLA